MGDFMMLDLKYIHKSKKAPANPLKLSAGRESATHKINIPYFIQNVYNENEINNFYLKDVYK